jgi:membrane protein implicated in regulation of membrane protease activity
MVILPYSFVQVKLYFIYASIHLFPERNRIKLVFAGFVTPFAYAVGLGRPCFSPGVFNIFNVQIQGIFMMFPVTAILAAAVGQNTQERYSLIIKKWNNNVIEHVSRDKHILAAVQFAERRFRIRVDECLLIYMPDTLNM